MGPPTGKQMCLRLLFEPEKLRRGWLRGQHRAKEEAGDRRGEGPSQCGHPPKGVWECGGTGDSGRTWGRSLWSPHGGWPLGLGFARNLDLCHSS